MTREHHYELQLVWTGNDGEGTRTYRGYRRDHVVAAPGLPDLPGSSDPAFRGDPSRWNPEQLLVASLSQCHMLWYLHFAATNGIVVVSYEDAPTGTMVEGPDGGGAFREVVLRPRVTIAHGDLELAPNLAQPCSRCLLHRALGELPGASRTGRRERFSVVLGLVIRTSKLPAAVRLPRSRDGKRGSPWNPCRAACPASRSSATSSLELISRRATHPASRPRRRLLRLGCSPRSV